MKSENGTVARLLAVILLPLSIVVTAAGRDQPRSSQPPIAAPKNVEFAGGDGNGCDRAIVLRGSKGARDSVASEMAWLGARYPGYKFRDNTVETRGGRTFEEIVIETATGERKVVCFDVTEGFGYL
jgi:hypothetical protein